MPNKIQIDSFLKKRKTIINDLNSLEENWENFFYNINALSLKELEDYLKAGDFYIEGALCIEIDNVKLLSFRAWDLIDQLWSYFLSALYSIISKKEKHSEFYFPDQALKVEISKIYADNILLKIGNNTYTINLSTFMPVFLQSAESFFLNLSRVVGLYKYETEFDKIKALKTLPL